MARIDKGLVILVGRDRENPRTHREAFEITDGLGEMLDKHIKRNNLNKSEFIREAVAAKLEAEMLKEPLIKDEKIRKAVRAFAELNNSATIIFELSYGESSIIARADNGFAMLWVAGESWETNGKGIKWDEPYTIAELCGEDEE